MMVHLTIPSKSTCNNSRSEPASVGNYGISLFKPKETLRLQRLYVSKPFDEERIAVGREWNSVALGGIAVT